MTLSSAPAQAQTVRSSTPALLRHSAGLVAATAVSAALMAASVLIPAVHITPAIPLTFQMLAVFLIPLLFGPRVAAMGIGLYVLLGAFGLPVFSGFRSGFGVLLGPTGGYLLGFIAAGAVIGLLSHSGRILLARSAKSAPAAAGVFAGAALFGILIVHLFGITGLHLASGMSWGAAFTTTLAFLPADLIKAALAVLVALPVLRTFSAQLLPR